MGSAEIVSCSIPTDLCLLLLREPLMGKARRKLKARNRMVDGLRQLALPLGRYAPGPGQRVYVLWAKHTQLYKIGYTSLGTSGVMERMKPIQGYCPTKVDVIVHFPGTPGLEKRLHRNFKEYRVEGEWFELPEECVWWLIDQDGVRPGNEWYIRGHGSDWFKACMVEN